MAKTAELYDGTTLEFPDDTPDEVIGKAAAEETARIRGTKPAEAEEPAEEPAPTKEEPTPRGKRRGTNRAVEPFVGGDEKTGPAGGGRGVVNPPLVGEGRRPGESVLDVAARPPQLDTPQPGPSLSDRDLQVMQAESVSPREQARVAGNLATLKGTGTVSATPLAQRLGADVQSGLKAGLGNMAAPVQGVVSGVADLGKVLPGALAAGADLVGADRVSEFAQGAIQHAGGVQKGVMPAGDGIDSEVAKVFQSITANAPVMALGVAGQGVALRTMFAQTAAANYGELRAAGFAPLPSVAASTINSGAEVLGERFGFREQTIAVKGLMERMMRHGSSTDDMAKNAAKLMLKELPGEELTTTIQFLNEKYGFAPRSPEATLTDYFKQLAETAITTMGQSAVVGGTPALIDAGKKTLKRAEDAINRSAGLLPKGPYREAAEKGFTVDPPLITDSPSTQRTKTLAIFDEAAATAGMSAASIKRAKEAAAEMPARDVGPFLDDMLTALTRKGGVATPVPEHVRTALTAGPAIPLTPDELAEADLASKTTAELAKIAEKEAATPAEAAPAPVAAVPATDETAATPTEGLQPEAPSLTTSTLKRTAAGWKVTPVDEAAHAAATSPQNELPEPTAAQALAGNYAKGHTKIGGLDISIENPEGSTRSDKNNDPPKWSTVMRQHYGYIRGTVGQDGEHIDTFIQPGTADDYSGNVFVIDQVDERGQPDEHKVMLGFETIQEARKAYLANYAKGWKGLGAISATTMDGFKSWLKDGDTTKPFKATNEQPDVQPAAQLAPQPAPAGGDQPGGSVGAMGRPAAAQPVPGARAPAAAPAPSVRSAAPAGDGSAAPAAVGTRVIAKAGTTPSTASPIELRKGKGGKFVAWHDGYELLDFDNAQPIEIPATATDREALDIIKQAGALGRRMKVFQDKPEAAEVEAPAGTPEPAETAPDVPGSSPSISEAKPEAKKGPGRSAAASKTAKKRIAFKPETDSVLQALAKMGGIKRELVASEFGLRPEELKHKVNAGNLVNYPFRANGGMGIDQAITNLQEAGYFPGVPDDEVRRTLETAIHDELAGARVLTIAGQVVAAEAAFEDNLAAERDELMDEAGISEAEMAALDDDDIDLDGKSNVTVQAFMRAMGFSEKEIADETAKQARDAQERPAEDVPPLSPAAGPADGSGSAEARPEPAGSSQELTTAEAFAGDYAALEGKTIEQPVLVADTGQTATLKFDAAKAMRTLDAREKAMKSLLDCITKKAA